MRRRLRHRRQQVAAAAGGEPEPRIARPDPAARGARSGSQAAGGSPPGRFELAIGRFNASDAGRTVAGLSRTLGAPWVSVGAVAGAPGQVRITVAWELTWYQWAVDLGDDSGPVVELHRGSEIEQLDSPARQWNASAAEGGRIVLVAPGRGTAGGAARR